MHSCLSFVISTFLLAVSLLPWESVDASVVWLPQFVSRKAAPNYYLGRRAEYDADKRGWGISSLTDAANSAMNSASDLVDNAPSSFDDVSNLATDLGNSAFEKGTQLAAENGLPSTAEELQAFAQENGVPMSLEEAQTLAAENGLPSNLAELELLAAENGVPMDMAELQALAASQGLPTDMASLELLAAANGVDISQYQELPLGEMAAAAGQIAASNSEGALVSIEILDKLAEVKTLANLIKSRCGVAPPAEIGGHESSEVTDVEAEKRGDLVRAFAGKRGDLVRAFAGKRGDLVRAFAGKRADDESLSNLVGLGAQLAPMALNPMGTLAGGAGGAAQNGNLYAILAEVNEVVIQLKELA